MSVKLHVDLPNRFIIIIFQENVDYSSADIGMNDTLLLWKLVNVILQIFT